jgi:hypothetical protein
VKIWKGDEKGLSNGTMFHRLLPPIKEGVLTLLRNQREQLHKLCDKEEVF